MKVTLNKILLGSALVLASAGIGWAEPSPDLMNSITSIRLQAGKTAENKPVILNAKHECTGCRTELRTRDITAGQSTVAVPVDGCCKK